jgi:4-aminobutyrate aminotransferase / (S)-3-amino-2-methylpropionate transaminase / 5-aminovalerate transaminase
VSELPRIVVPPPGPQSRALSDRLVALESPAFETRRHARERASGASQTPIVYAHGIGSNVFDVDGNRYVDFTAGFGALVLGYGPNAATDAARSALDRLTLALGDVYASDTKVAACEAIAGLFPEPARVMLGTSGADAVTCAMKTALLATRKPGVVAFEGAYHGLSYGPLAACGFSPAFRAAFAEHLGVSVTFAPYPAGSADLDASLSAVRRAEAGAILVEPILGRGGCIVPPDDFLPALREIADDKNMLLVVDEIWTGVGRTGPMLASVDAIVPDVLCLGKGLGGGLPISACVARAPVMEAWGGQGGTRIHTATHFGSPPACAAAMATIEAVSGIRDVAARGDAFRAALERVIAGRATVRGRGLMIGIDLGDAARALTVMRALLERGYITLTGGIDGSTLTLSPPLTIEPFLLDAFAEAIADVV